MPKAEDGESEVGKAALKVLGVAEVGLDNIRQRRTQIRHAAREKADKLIRERKRLRERIKAGMATDQDKNRYRQACLSIATLEQIANHGA